EGHDHVEVAVAVVVHRVAVDGGAGPVVDYVPGPRLRRRRAGVLVPDDAGAVAVDVRDVRRHVFRADGRAQQIDLAVAVEVPRADRPRLGHLVADDKARPLPDPALLAGVLVPGDQ